MNDNQQYHMVYWKKVVPESDDDSLLVEDLLAEEWKQMDEMMAQKEHLQEMNHDHEVDSLAAAEKQIGALSSLNQLLL